MASAQSKEEKKKLKQELKTYAKMKPAEIRQMKLNYENKLSGMDALNTQLRQSRSKQDSLQNLLNTTQSKLRSTEADLANAKSAQREVINIERTEARGYYYRVQLGAYRYFDIKDKLKTDNPNGGMMVENADGMDKYLVGLFFKFEDADAFKEDIRRMGIKDAYVVPYKDGKRITHKEAREGIMATGGMK